MSDHGEQQPEDHSICIKVSVFFIGVIAMLFIIGAINKPAVSSNGDKNPTAPTHIETSAQK